MKRLSKISIIIPVFNAEKYIQDVLSDLIKQTYSNIQIIVVDDGSTDGSRKIVESFMVTDKRICLVISENRGPSSARNLGIEYAEGEFVRFIDSDDRIPIDSMENLVMPFLKDQEVDLVIGNYICTAEKNYYTGETIREEKKTAEEFAKMFVSQVKSFYFGVPWNKLYKKEIFDRNHIRFDEKIRWCEDFLFNIEYYKSCNNIYFVNKKQGVYNYFEREGGITVKLSDWSQTEINRIDKLRYEKALEYFDKYGLKDICSLEWCYSGLYYKLSKLAQIEKGKTLKGTYQDFYGLLSEERVYRYICIVNDDTKLAIWRFLKKSIEKKKYRRAFFLFVIKEFIATLINSKIPFLKKKIKANIPKFL